MSRLPRLYVDQQVRPGPLALDIEASRRVVGVLRLRVGDSLAVFCGDGREWRAELARPQKDRAAVQVVEPLRQEAVPALRIEAWVGLVRAQRFEWAIEKCTEVGVDVIRPLISEHAARGEQPSAQRQARWERIAVEASEQSGRVFIPVIAEPTPFARLLDLPRGTLVVADPAGEPPAAAAAGLPEAGRMVVAVGPEGGFSGDESAQARAAGARLMALGPHILRTETAAVVAVAALRAARR